MRIATCKQSQEIDRISQEEYHLSGEVLMESAGCIAAREITQFYLPEISQGSIGVLCGPGNNGGDGLVVARHLHSSGYRDLIVFVLGAGGQFSDLFNLQLLRAQKQGLNICTLTSDHDIEKHQDSWNSLASCKLFVDAIFGVGLSRDVTGDFYKVIEKVNSLKAPKIALDIPSGLDGDRGQVRGIAIQSHLTISFGLAKSGFFVSEGPSHIGRLKVVPIGFPYEVLRKVATSHFAFDEKLARRYLPKRQDQANKSNFGHLMLFAGSPGMWGASLLAASAAYRLGSGYVTLVASEEAKEVVSQHPEIMTRTWGDPEVFKKKISAYGLGPGLGVSEKTKEMIEKLKSLGAEKVVIDADGISACVKYNLFPLPESWVVTPHAGELSRVLSVEVKEIEENRFQYALKAAEVTGCHVLLKGFRSVLAHGDRCMVIMSGNSSLATAGSGDVLTGMIGGLLVQGLPTVQAAATAAYLHGRVADEWVRSGKSKSSLVPSDLTEHLPSLLGRIEGGHL